MKKFSQKTISRSFLYIRTLEQLIRAGETLVSSKKLADITGLTDVQIRKDISNFGKVGRPRIGYKITELKKILEDFVLQHIVHVSLFGVGNLGSAILKYPGFHQEKVEIVAAFEKDKRKIGKKINGVSIYSVEDAPRVVSKMHTEIGIIAVPEEYAQQVADIIVACGLHGIINFSPVSINVPKDVSVKNIDLAIEFLSLYCEMQL
ncbi:MAG: redox-sensing transcriptional repressor Rex [PVC group bacterium]|nr:redox-sensing transcriptional repressor Rex [PVC group bacterium]